MKLLGLALVLIINLCSHATASPSTGGPSSFLAGPDSVDRSSVGFGYITAEYLSKSPSETLPSKTDPRLYAASRPVWLEVHTYFVAAREGAPEIWVHNPGILSEGTNLERRAMRWASEDLGETVIRSQFKRGFAQRGFDFLSIRGTGSNAELIINEAKSYAGVAENFTVFGLGRGGAEIYQQAKDVAASRLLKALNRGKISQATYDTVLSQLQNDRATVRLIGDVRKGTRFTGAVKAIREATGLQKIRSIVRR